MYVSYGEVGCVAFHVKVHHTSMISDDGIRVLCGVVEEGVGDLSAFGSSVRLISRDGAEGHEYCIVDGSSVT